MQIGPWQLPNNVFVAPMAGVTDRPFRRLCKRLGAGHAVSEMAASNPELWNTIKTARRLDHRGEVDPIAVQIVGADPEMMAQAAVFNIEKGAKIIDINMGCPAKKVCKVATGSALLRDEALVARILEAVLSACQPYEVPVTLKIRTGWDAQSINAPTIAKLAESIGISALTIHGRTRCDFYQGQAEYKTIAAVKKIVKIPIIANGDIDSPQKAKQVLDYTGADAIMIGRAAQGNPWIFREIAHYLSSGNLLPPPTLKEMKEVLLAHLEEHYHFYGAHTGVRTARKHIGWYLSRFSGSDTLRRHLNTIESCQQQSQVLADWFEQQAELELSA
ncbi:tRNA-dihydrouridine synthase B [Oligella urethralis]|uniref:tRNA dihydrouridine synthase DusB n=1 Tax=Oligella urethralis TaxID=90245 RepID=UPI002958A918|nr:tRNA dihydrouridine synthase DusB [Oligella urethralis]WOS38300.1 tRNA-dihydrouridine synthase B [Oligella urethralis]